MQAPPDQQASSSRCRGTSAARTAGPTPAPRAGSPTTISPSRASDERDLVPAQRRDRRRDRRDAGRDRHRHRQRVVDHQRRRRDERRSRPEVLAAHDVRAAAARIRVQRLAVARGHDRQQRDHDQRDRHEIVERRHPRHRNQDDQDLLRRERSRRDRIGPEDGQRRPACSAAAPPAPPMPAAIRSGAASAPNTRRRASHAARTTGGISALSRTLSAATESPAPKCETRATTAHRGGSRSFQLSPQDPAHHRPCRRHHQDYGAGDDKNCDDE